MINFLFCTVFPPGASEVDQTQKKNVNTKITISNYISTIKNRTKKIICAKNERQVNSNLPFKFGYF